MGTIDLTDPLCGRMGHYRIAPTFRIEKRRLHKQAEIGRGSLRVLPSAATMVIRRFEVRRGN